MSGKALAPRCRLEESVARAPLASAVALVTLAAVALTAVLVSRPDEWRSPALLAVLLALAVVGDRFQMVTASGSRVVGSHPAWVLAATLAGPAAAAAIGVVASLLHEDRRPFARLTGSVAIFAAFPLLTGLAARAVQDVAHLRQDSVWFALLVAGAFMLAWIINFVLVALYRWLWKGDRPSLEADATLKPLLDGQLAMGLMTALVPYLYARLGLAAFALAGYVLLVYANVQRRLLQAKTDADELRGQRDRLARVNFGMVRAMLEAIDARDRMTARHSAAVARYAQGIARANGCSAREIELVHTAGLLHDVGKFMFPDDILKGDARLTDEQFAVVRRHPEQGAEIIRRLEGYEEVAELILCHHERTDGRGYPRGLQGNEIPLLARMIAIADTYDVMTARDSYREPVPPEAAVDELHRVAGAQLDAELVEVFIEQVLADGSVGFRHGDAADFEAELDIERRVRDYLRGDVTVRPQLGVAS